ncbi:MAG: signal peptidase II [Actinomycetota bacterium]
MSSPPRRATRNYGPALATGAAVVVLDLLTKRWASSSLTSRPTDVLGSFLQVRFVENTGAAFSMFQGAGTFFGIAAVVAIGVVLWFLRSARNGWEVVGLGLVMGGAAGNLIDRVARGEGLLDGAVIDWVNLWFIPTFNIADASITVAVVTLLVGSWLND